MSNELILETSHDGYTLTIVDADDKGRAKATIVGPDGEVFDEGYIFAYKAWTVAAHLPDLVRDAP